MQDLPQYNSPIVLLIDNIFTCDVKPESQIAQDH